MNDAPSDPTTSGRKWTPLLTGRLQQAALESVDAIAAVAHVAIEEWAARGDDRTGIDGVSLACGRAGVALFYAYHAAATGASDDVATELLDRTIDAMAEKAVPASLYCGFSGVAWLGEHMRRLRGEPILPDEDDANEAIDAALIEHLAESRPDAEWDLIDGLTGIGVYAVERLPRASGRRCLELVVERLEQLARPQYAGLSWPTPAVRAGEDGAAGAGQYFNLGAAHGVPGIIALLGLALASGAHRDRAALLLKPAVTWLLAQQLPHGPSRFASSMGPGIEPLPARCAWCYGDPGVAITLLCAARCAGRGDWEREALEIARHAARGRENRPDVRDGCLCHGAAGLAHTFNRIYQLTGDGELLAASLFWFERSLAQRLPSRGLAGFRNWSLERTPEGEWIDDPRFLTGIPGMGLALLAAATSLEPAWDRIMLMSVPGHLAGEPR